MRPKLVFEAFSILNDGVDGYKRSFVVAYECIKK